MHGVALHIRGMSLPALTLILCGALQGCVAETEVAPAQGDDVSADPTVVFLVRHAEKALEPAADPPLTAGGADRALTLAALLGDAGIDAIYSTRTLRTMNTAEPLGLELGLATRAYDPGDLAGFADQLREEAGKALVVGHSNTTPQLVELLGGDPGPPIDEGGEYDRLYVLLITEGGVETTLLRFGEPYRDPMERDPGA